LLNESLAELIEACCDILGTGSNAAVVNFLHILGLCSRITGLVEFRIYRVTVMVSVRAYSESNVTSPVKFRLKVIDCLL